MKYCILYSDENGQRIVIIMMEGRMSRMVHDVGSGALGAPGCW